MYYTLDIETDGLAGKFLIGGIYSKENGFEYFENEREYWLYIIKLAKGKNRFFAHFGGRYDYQYFLNFVLLNKISVKLKIIYSSKIIMFKLQNSFFYDTYNIFLTSLEKVEKNFGIERTQSKKIGQNMSEEFYKNNKEIVIDYLSQDCKNLYTAIEKFEAKLNTKIKATIASQAMHIYNTQFKKDLKFEIEKDYERDFFRSCYYGGRTEVFKRYGKNLYYYDINSSYPYVMKNFQMPVGGITFTREYVENVIGFYDIVLTDYDVDLPYIAKKFNGKLVYPTGTFQAFVTNLEIDELIKDKQKFKVVRGYFFRDIQKIFSEYIDYFYNMKEVAKQNDDSLNYFISKLFMNSLYGKFGERENKKTIIKATVKEVEKMVKEGKRVYDFRSDLGLFTIDEKVSLKNIHVQISAWITAVARWRLWRFMRKILRAGYELYYCDTDSIVTNANPEVLQRLNIKIDEFELGALKLEHKINEGYFLLPKFYFIDVEESDKAITKVKGFTNNDFDIDYFKDYLFNNQNKFYQKERYMVGFKDGLKRFGSCVINLEGIKNIINDYDKRMLEDNNINTKPLKINEFEKEKLLFKNLKEKHKYEIKQSLSIRKLLENKVDTIDYSQYVIENDIKFNDDIPF